MNWVGRDCCCNNLQLYSAKKHAFRRSDKRYNFRCSKSRCSLPAHWHSAPPNHNTQNYVSCSFQHGVRVADCGHCYSYKYPRSHCLCSHSEASDFLCSTTNKHHPIVLPHNCTEQDRGILPCPAYRPEAIQVYQRFLLRVNFHAPSDWRCYENTIDNRQANAAFLLNRR
ncbi:hypothetical protein SDC9_93718 [bioreactor metagenome]|uniref:Uncharacterized protein n=1 Tax=bioreactor metagenome TaxID=1076179 RepID=A0A645A1D5_9ZZZZ